MKNQTNLLALAALLLLTATPALFATPVPLAPASSVTFTASTGAFAGTFVTSESPTPFSNAFESGTFTEDVYSNDGFLDFYYQVTDNAISSDSLSRLTVGDFKGFTTSVDYLSNGDVAPTNATRQKNGTSVGFNFGTDIEPGQSSDFVEVVTDATAYGPGTASIIDSLTSNLMALGPLAVPEPSTTAILLCGLGALAFVLRRRSGSKA